jgi:DNA-binding transcriptional regulator YhcF (GntR family)
VLTIFPSKPYTITNPKYATGLSGDQEFSGSNPSSSALITYYQQKRHVFGDMSIEIYNSNGELVKTLPAGKNKGINYVEWAIRKKPPKVKAANPMLAFRTAFGPTFPPGEYTVKIKKGETIYEGKVTLQTDPSTGHSAEDMNLQYETLSKAYSLLEDISFTDRHATDLMDKLNKIKSKVASEDLKNEITELTNKLESMHKELVATSTSRISGEVRLAEKVADIYSGIISYSGKPTDSQIQGLNLLSGVYDNYKEQMNKILGEDLQNLNSKLKNSGLEEIKVITREEYDKS